MNEETADWHNIVQGLADIDEDDPMPFPIDAERLWVGVVAMAKVITRLEVQLEVLSDRIDWEKM